MPTKKSAALKKAGFAKVGENLYRYNPQGTYYALAKKSGKQIRRSLKTDDRKLAERRLADFKKKLDRIEPSVSKAPIEFPEAAEIWLESMRAHLKPSSALRRETSIKQLKKTFGHSTVRKITRTQCEEWATRRSQGIAASTFNNERETLVSILDYAEREGFILDNPARVIRRRRLGKAQLRIPSREQFKTLVKTMRSMDPRYRAAADLVELLAYSGMRKGEANNLRWEEVDFQKGSFLVTGGSTGTKNHDVRHVPMFPVLRNFLERLKEEYIAVNPSDLVVPIQNAKKAIAAACKKAELPPFNHHSFRHYFVSNAIEKGIDFKVIAQWIGHKDGGVLVAQTYGHLRDVHSFEMAKRMED